MLMHIRAVCQSADITYDNAPKTCAEPEACMVSGSTKVSSPCWSWMVAALTFLKDDSILFSGVQRKWDGTRWVVKTVASTNKLFILQIKSISGPERVQFIKIHKRTLSYWTLHNYGVCHKYPLSALHQIWMLAWFALQIRELKRQKGIVSYSKSSNNGLKSPNMSTENLWLRLKLKSNKKCSPNIPKHFRSSCSKSHDLQGSSCPQWITNLGAY